MIEKVVYHGAGYVGLTGAITFARKGVKAVCYDPDRRVVEAIKTGRSLIPNLTEFLQFEWGFLVSDGFLKPTSNYEDTLDIPVHIVAVPTEKDGEAYMDILNAVVHLLVDDVRTPELTLILESTLTPGTMARLRAEIDERHPDKTVYLASAPRRDFFADSEFSVEKLTRIVGGDSEEATQRALEVLSIVSDSIITTNAEQAELSKSLENSLLHVPVMYLIELSRLYSHIDFQEAVRLASTHWRIPKYYVDLAVSGYCVPLGTRYVVQGAHGRASIAERVIDAERAHSEAVSEWLKEWAQGGGVAFLGVSYKADFKVPHMSAASRMIPVLKNKGVDVYAHDPYFSKREIEALGAKPFHIGFPKAKTVVLSTAHTFYRGISRRDFAEYERILDVPGMLKIHRRYFEKRGVDYRHIGEKGWIE